MPSELRTLFVAEIRDSQMAIRCPETKRNPAFAEENDTRIVDTWRGEEPSTRRWDPTRVEASVGKTARNVSSWRASSLPEQS
jgi:hypothetical protein